jgi:NADH:ubiquinone oxidoreductase subunit 6 (subunit J)
VINALRNGGAVLLLFCLALFALGGWLWTIGGIFLAALSVITWLVAVGATILVIAIIRAASKSGVVRPAA